MELHRRKDASCRRVLQEIGHTDSDGRVRVEQHNVDGKQPTTTNRGIGHGSRLQPIEALAIAADYNPSKLATSWFKTSTTKMLRVMTEMLAPAYNPLNHQRQNLRFSEDYSIDEPKLAAK